MSGKHQYESRVKRNAVIIYLLASLLCAGMIHYIVNLKKSINFQRDNIEINDKLLSLTNDLIEKVNEAQSFANLYSFDGDNNQLNNYRETLKHINSINDSILSYYTDTTNKKILDEITELLESKEQIVKEISSQYSTFNPYQEIYTIIDSYKPHKNNNGKSKENNESKQEKKSFIKHAGEILMPQNFIDSISILNKTDNETVEEEKDDEISTDELLHDLELYTEKGRKDYVKEVIIIENRYKNLVFSDQEISKEISDLLIMLHKQTLDSVMNDIQKSEAMINKNINLSIIIAAAALLIILTFIFLIFYDVRKVIQARKDTEDAQKRTEEIMESRHKLLLSVSHDVKAPLSSILGYLELMQMDIKKNDDKRRISSMKNSAEHILSLLTNLLNFSRLDQGKETPIFSEFSIGTICDELAEMFSPIAENKRLSFIYTKEFDNNIYIKSDALKIKQILSNLLSNAIKYTIKGDIVFKSEIQDNKLIFNIIDNGIGIPEDKLEEIFTPFKRIENNNSIIEGSGFGLFVVKGLVDLLDGNIEVASEVGKGSQFTISIPVVISEYKEENEQGIDIQIMKSEEEMLVLIIDDDNSLLTVIQSMLSKLNVKSMICHSPIEFETYIKELDNFDLVLTDREMGAFSGVDVLKKVKDIDSEKKVYLMTARSEYNEDIAESKGFDGYLPKPFSIKDLAELLKCKIVYSSNDDNRCRFYEDFPELCSMFDNDETSVNNILKVFVESTSNNLMIFNDIIDSSDFRGAISLSHKMYPMFVQLGQKELSDFLSKMDKSRSIEESDFPEWKEESIIFMNKTDDFISFLSDKYGIE